MLGSSTQVVVEKRILTELKSVFIPDYFQNFVKRWTYASKSILVGFFKVCQVYAFCIFTANTFQTGLLLYFGERQLLVIVRRRFSRLRTFVNVPVFPSNEAVLYSMVLAHSLWGIPTYILSPGRTLILLFKNVLMYLELGWLTNFL